MTNPGLVPNSDAPQQDAINEAAVAEKRTAFDARMMALLSKTFPSAAQASTLSIAIIFAMDDYAALVEENTRGNEERDRLHRAIGQLQTTPIRGAK